MADPELQTSLDTVVTFSPPRTCLTVSIAGSQVYDHQGHQPLLPASTQKLYTAQAALDALGGDATFTTSVLAAAPAADGVLQGDLTLLGGGDPVLVTDAYRVLRGIGDDEAFTSFDALAAQLAATGITRVTGRVVGDESRYDQLRSVPSWPDRYVADGESGPLSALGVDDGYDLTLPPPESGQNPSWKRSTDPAASAARLLTNRLLIRGIRVDGAQLAGSGTATPDLVELAKVTSPSLGEIVDEMLLSSDNQIAELLAKELGHHAGEGGTTAAGTAVIDESDAQAGTERPDSRSTDGSGLDLGNRTTCADLVSLLESVGGPDSAIGRGLPVAGRTGTLSRRFRGTPAEGVLRAKTGSLDFVSALAGYVDLPDGSVASFAYVVNEIPAGSDIRASTELLGSVLAGYRPPCPGQRPGTEVLPLTPAAVLATGMAMVPMGPVAGPGVVAALDGFQARFRNLVDVCLAFDPTFDLTVTPQGPASRNGSAPGGT